MALTISATVLGELAQPGFCHRCFWTRLKSRKLPYQQFPGIFSSIDRYVKQVPHYTRFRFTDPRSGVTLRGKPDDVLRLVGDTYHIVDYKTARFTSNAEGMYPRYEAQFNAYAYIGNRTVFSPVSGLSLIYLEPDTDVEGDPGLLARSQEEFLLGFTPKLRSVEMKPDSFVEALLLAAREIDEQDTPTAGRSGCKECQAVQDLMELTRP